jgi:diadenosine tetraphosphate (Ap4A) HIT family hydrolase
MLPDGSALAHTQGPGSDSGVPYPKIPFDLDAYEQRVRTDSTDGRCFICSIVSGERDDHLVLYRDDVCVAFLAKFPTLLGYTLVAPLGHRTDVVGSFSETEYVELQSRVHRVGRALTAAVPTERLYVLSLGSHQGNAHVHWHLAPLPPGVPYREQQYAALMHEQGHLDIPDDDLVALARDIERRAEGE